MNTSTNTIIKTLVIILCVILYLISVSSLQVQLSGVTKYLVLSSALFAIGLYGLLTAKSIIKVFICLELLFNATGINLIAFGHYNDVSIVRGQIMNLFVMGVAAAEIAIGLALLLTIFAKQGITRMNKLNSLTD